MTMTWPLFAVLLVLAIILGVALGRLLRSYWPPKR
jgi:hypothetical protein